MRVTMTMLLLLSGLAGLTAASGQEPAAELTVLADWMTGSFSSAQQAAADTSYFDIRLEMIRIPRKDGRIWLYVEQAAAGKLGTKPYRQRVYRLEAVGDGSFLSHVYTIPGDPLRFAGAYGDPELLASIPLDSLTLLEGCSIELMSTTDGTFSGGTDGRSCGNSWGEATYATSEVTVTPDALRSWDRGYNDAGEQVWGAEKGGYVFEKIANR